MTTSDVTLSPHTRLAARSDAVDEPFDLLDVYAPDGFAWLDGNEGFVASGIAALVAPAAGLPMLAKKVTKGLTPSWYDVYGRSSESSSTEPT